MDEYEHPLFFGAKDLTDREKEKIRRHFQNRRQSGGGECGNINKVGDNTYTICFKDKDDQERVLQRKFHTVSLPDGAQRLTVSRTNAVLTSDQPLTSQLQTFTKENTKGLEKIFNIDVFILYYLRDVPKAFRVLQKQLFSINCTVELNVDEEEAVVRGDIEKGPGGAFGGAAERWELQVDRVFISLSEAYLCYHVFEPKQIKSLQQDRSFATDDIKVYVERGYAVVVGETETVKEKIANLEKSMPIRKELPIVEKKFQLVEEEFNQEMCAHYPEVKILRSSDMIILCGRDKEVQSGAAKLDELMTKIKEKRVQLPTALINFITSSGAISKYQTRFQQRLRNPVSIEVELDLVLSSLSSECLDEAEATVLRDMKVTTVQLQGAAAVPPDLDKVKETLNKAKNTANCREHRVDVSFIPVLSGTPVTKVQLVGYTENVNMFQEVLHDYQMNQVTIQEALNLPHPQLVDCFDKILNLIGRKLSNVTVKPSYFPNPCVLVSGPRCRVQETQKFLMSAFANVTVDTLVLDGPGARRFFQAEGKVSKELVESSCHVVIREQQGVDNLNVQTKPRSSSSPSSSSSSSTITPGPSTARFHSNTVGSIPVNKINLKIKLGSLEDEQLNVLVAPILKKQPNSTKVSKSLITKAGNSFKLKFDSVAANHTLTPGDVLTIDGPPSLGYTKIFFIECLPWNGVRGTSVQALSKGIKKCLDLCAQTGLSSISIPVIGPGIVLKYPLREAIQVLTENICQFASSAFTGSLSTIHIVIKPGYPDSEECYHEVYKHLSLNMTQGGQVIFRSLTSDLDDITMALGGRVKLHVVFGDITNETTDAVVNSTDFTNFNYGGVCKDILTIAGPEVEAELKAAQVIKGGIFVSQPGQFPCKAILHVCAEKSTDLTEQLMCDIVKRCELNEFKSVAIPAICGGVGGLEPDVVASAILRGIKAVTSVTPLRFLTDIRLVLIKINIFLAFKEEAMLMFPTGVINRVSAPQLPYVQQQQPPPSPSADLSILHTRSACQQSVFLFVGLSRDHVDDAMTKLKDLYQVQCSSQILKTEELKSLNQDNMEDLKQVVEAEGLYVQRDSSGNLMVSGLKDGVNQMMQVANRHLHGCLRREVRVREEKDLYTRVVWCILGHNGAWQRLPKTANHNLEHNDVAGGVMDAQGLLWSVDLQRMEATRQMAGQTAKLKRLENLSDFTLPLYWDSMTSFEVMKMVELQSSSPEYKTVKQDFKRTASKTVIKIMRLQNIHLRRAYEAQKKHISEKNAGGAGEKSLYHGTTHDNCNSIMKTGFNRRFAGQNATSFGHGTYFAVNASYSAHPTYSKPAADGSQLMFVARVLTGVHTQGQSDMKVPPPLNSQQPHDRYDSVVDRMDNPSMYIVFHDNQAYPDYLITFK